MLYAMDITRDYVDSRASIFWEDYLNIEKEVKSYADSLVEGVIKNKLSIDGAISKYTTNWQIDRIATVDRNILSIATFELLFSADIPPKVSINEAVEVAKKYGDQESGKFVNGVLDKINKTVGHGKK